jgi:glucose-6-phosphate 1-dehydrogenase
MTPPAAAMTPTQPHPDGTGAHSEGTEPAVFVIFGATGDLAKRKIIPALWQLHKHQLTARGCLILGVSRGTISDDAAFRATVRDAIPAEDGAAADVAAWAEQWVYYQATESGDSSEFVTLKARIEQLEREHGLPGNRVFYLSLPPQAFPPTISGLGAAKLNQGPGWSRIVIEKPFGRDLESAQALNRLVHQYFDESQIYRIDHYLGKETVQNLLVFRFANAMFESLWNRDHIESVEITVAEELGVEQRAGYYEHAGALRDMVQSHLTQLVALVGMEVPSAFEGNAIREEKVKVLRSIAAIGPADAVFGQYAAGRIRGQLVPGYREEPGVSPTSITPTFVALRINLDNWRWQGVPFYIRTGKRMARRLTEIRVRFRKAPIWMFRSVASTAPQANTLVITLQPNEGFLLFFDVKAPGDPFRLQRLTLHFDYDEEFKTLPEAYQTLLLDLLLGDQTLFVHADEVEASWRIYSQLLDLPVPPYPYPAGSWGPTEAGVVVPDREPREATESNRGLQTAGAAA